MTLLRDKTFKSPASEARGKSAETKKNSSDVKKKTGVDKNLKEDYLKKIVNKTTHSATSKKSDKHNSGILVKKLNFVPENSLNTKSKGGLEAFLEKTHLFDHDQNLPDDVNKTICENTNEKKVTKKLGIPQSVKNRNAKSPESTSIPFTHPNDYIRIKKEIAFVKKTKVLSNNNDNNAALEKKNHYSMNTTKIPLPEYSNVKKAEEKRINSASILLSLSANKSKKESDYKKKDKIPFLTKHQKIKGSVYENPITYRVYQKPNSISPDKRISRIARKKITEVTGNNTVVAPRYPQSQHKVTKPSEIPLKKNSKNAANKVQPISFLMQKPIKESESIIFDDVYNTFSPIAECSIQGEMIYDDKDSIDCETNGFDDITDRWFQSKCNNETDILLKESLKVPNIPLAYSSNNLCCKSSSNIRKGKFLNLGRVKSFNFTELVSYSAMQMLETYHQQTITRKESGFIDKTCSQTKLSQLTPRRSVNSIKQYTVFSNVAYEEPQPLEMKKNCNELCFSKNVSETTLLSNCTKLPKNEPSELNECLINEEQNDTLKKKTKINEIPSAIKLSKIVEKQKKHWNENEKPPTGRTSLSKLPQNQRSSFSNKTIDKKKSEVLQSSEKNLIKSQEPSTSSDSPEETPVIKNESFPIFSLNSNDILTSQPSILSIDSSVELTEPEVSTKNIIAISSVLPSDIILHPKQSADQWTLKSQKLSESLKYQDSFKDVQKDLKETFNEKLAKRMKKPSKIMKGNSKESLTPSESSRGKENLSVKGVSLELFKYDPLPTESEKMKLEIKIDLNPENDASDNVDQTENQIGILESDLMMFINDDDDNVDVDHYNDFFSENSDRKCNLKDDVNKENFDEETRKNCTEPTADGKFPQGVTDRKTSLESFQLKGFKSFSSLKKEPTYKQDLKTVSKAKKKKVKSGTAYLQPSMLATTGHFNSLTSFQSRNKMKIDAKARRGLTKAGNQEKMTERDLNYIFEEVAAVNLKRRNSEPYSFRGFIWKQPDIAVFKDDKASMSSLASSLRHMNADELEDFRVWEAAPINMTSCWEMSLYHSRRPWSLLSVSVFKDNRLGNTPGLILENLRHGGTLNFSGSLNYEKDRIKPQAANSFDIEPSIAQKNIDIKNWLSALNFASQPSTSTDAFLDDNWMAYYPTEDSSKTLVNMQKRKKILRRINYSEVSIKKKFEDKRNWVLGETGDLMDLIRRKSGGFVALDKFGQIPSSNYSEYYYNCCDTNFYDASGNRNSDIKIVNVKGDGHENSTLMFHSDTSIAEKTIDDDETPSPSFEELECAPSRGRSVVKFAVDYTRRNLWKYLVVFAVFFLLYNFVYLKNISSLFL